MRRDGDLRPRPHTLHAEGEARLKGLTKPTTKGVERATPTSRYLEVNDSRGRSRDSSNSRMILTRYLPVEKDPQIDPNSSADPESVLVKDIWPYLEGYTDGRLAEALGVDPSRIWRIRKKQHRVSFRIADALLTFVGLGHLLDSKIKVAELPAAVQTKLDRSDATDIQAGAPA